MHQGASRPLYVANLRKAARRAAAAGIEVIIEPINTRDIPGYFLSRTGEARAVILWPELSRSEPFRTSTGTFDLLVATTITEDEWKLARETSTAHLLALLVACGVGQRSDPHRLGVLEDERARRAWKRIAKLSPDGVLEELHGRA